MSDGIIQATFRATERRELPIFPFGAEVGVVIQGHSFLATITKATYVDKAQSGMHHKKQANEVHYTLEVIDPDA